jgi:hypothetical protein
MRPLSALMLVIAIAVSGCTSKSASQSVPAQATPGRFADSTVAFDYPDRWHAYAVTGCEATPSVGQTSVCVSPPGARQKWIAAIHGYIYEVVWVWTKPSYIQPTPSGIRLLASNEQAGIDATPRRTWLVGRMSVTTHGERPGFSYRFRSIYGGAGQDFTFFQGSRRYSVTCSWLPADQATISEGCARIASSLRAR